MNDGVRTLVSPEQSGTRRRRPHRQFSSRKPSVVVNSGTWVLRVILAGSAVFALIAGSPEAAGGAGLALVISFVPTLVGYYGRLRIPSVLVLAWLVGVALTGVSTALGLYDHLVHWGKFVHGTEAFLVAVVSGYLLLGYRDQLRLGVNTHVVALVTMFIGVTFGAFWEFLEFVLDWIRYSDLQKSNTDSMTDMLWNDLAAVVGTLVVTRVYYHWTAPAERGELGDLAEWLFAPIGNLLDRQGKLLAVVALLGIALYVAALWLSERPLPFVAPQ